MHKNCKLWCKRQRLTSGTCRWMWFVVRKLFVGSSWCSSLRATVSAIRHDSFITSPRWPVTSRVPPTGAALESKPGVSISCCRSAVSMKSVDPPASKKRYYFVVDAGPILIQFFIDHKKPKIHSCRFSVTPGKNMDSYTNTVWKVQSTPDLPKAP